LHALRAAVFLDAEECRVLRRFAHLHIGDVAVGAALAEAKLNIEDVRHSHHAPSDQSLAIFKLNQPASEALVQKVTKDIGAVIAFGATF
jgi:dihydroorotate dehydrogenase